MMRLRIVFALAGFVAALLSVALEDDRLAWAAIALLAVSFILRLVLRKRSHESSGTDGQV